MERLLCLVLLMCYLELLKVSSLTLNVLVMNLYLVMLKDSKWCWKVSEISAVIVKGSQDPLKFSHTGYSLSYEVSHDTLIVSEYLVS